MSSISYEIVRLISDYYFSVLIPQSICDKHYAGLLSKPSRIMPERCQSGPITSMIIYSQFAYLSGSPLHPPSRKRICKLNFKARQYFTKNLIGRSKKLNGFRPFVPSPFDGIKDLSTRLVNFFSALNTALSGYPSQLVLPICGVLKANRQGRAAALWPAQEQQPELQSQYRGCRRKSPDAL